MMPNTTIACKPLRLIYDLLGYGLHQCTLLVCMPKPHAEEEVALTLTP